MAATELLTRPAGLEVLLLEALGDPWAFEAIEPPWPHLKPQLAPDDIGVFQNVDH
jgi:hypothetical protein